MSLVEVVDPGWIVRSNVSLFGEKSEPCLVVGATEVAHSGPRVPEGEHMSQLVDVRLGRVRAVVGSGGLAAARAQSVEGPDEGPAPVRRGRHRTRRQ